MSRLENFTTFNGENSGHKEEQSKISKSELNSQKKDSSDLFNLMLEIKAKVLLAKTYQKKQQMLTKKPRSLSVKKSFQIL